MTELEQGVLAIESQSWRFEGAKHERIVATLGVTPTRFYQVLNSLIDRPEIEAAYPVLVHRLQRLRQGRREARRLS
jgi:hypothetical protein